MLRAIIPLWVNLAVNFHNNRVTMVYGVSYATIRAAK